MTQSSNLSDAQIDVIARVMHEAIRAFQTGIGQTAAPPWGNAPKWMQKASRDGVQFRLKNPNAGPSAQHDQWMQSKIDDGWKYGKEKDGIKKTHPLLVDYEQLPLEERQKDALVAAIIDSLTCKL